MRENKNYKRTTHCKITKKLVTFFSDQARFSFFKVPTESHDFKEGLLESDDGVKAVVQLGHEVWFSSFDFEIEKFNRNV